VLQSYPGGYFPVTRWVGLALEGPYAPESLRLARGRVERAAGAVSAWFVPPEATISPWPLRRERRTRLRGTYLHETCDLEQCIEGRWLPARVADAPTDWTQVAFRPPGPLGQDPGT
jgi:hypothetical protein